MTISAPAPGPAPIEDYAVVGDLQSMALVRRDGSVDWLCLPRIDSPAAFAALLGDDRNGRWLIAPEHGEVQRRAYLDGTMVLETVWRAPGGRVRVLDLMPPRGTAPGGPGPGEVGDRPDLVRVVEGLDGDVTMLLDLVVRFDYGRTVPWVRRAHGRWTAVAGPDRLWLDTPVQVNGQGPRTRARFTVRAGRRVPFVLTWTPGHAPAPTPLDADDAVDATVRFWHDWLAGCTWTGPYPAQVRRSLLTLKALTYAPTGGIAAAATTSLPEWIGGGRTWDYRYCWVRDAALTLEALMAGGFTDEAVAWRDWLVRAVAGDPADLQIMYSVTGRRHLPELVLGHLPGYAGSAPVRIGNGAAGQWQLDVPGELLDALHRARAAGLPEPRHVWAMQRSLTTHLADVWHRPDRSLWEVRGPERHYVHSKVMAWAGLDRMVRTARATGLPAPVERWAAARDAVHAEVMARGVCPSRGVLTQSYGSRGLDAALLLVPRTGFLPRGHPVVRATLRAVRETLVDDGFVLRYRTDADPAPGSTSGDGVDGPEGAFLACSFWLVEALADDGEVDAAVHLFERLLGTANDVGLLSEEWDPRARRQLGNTPQAFSHVGLVTAAAALGRAGVTTGT